MSSKKEDKLNELKDEFDKIQQSSNDMEIPKYLARTDEYLPDLGDIDIYDYEKDAEDCIDKANDVVSSLVDLYLGDSPTVANHPYIKNKMMEDADTYAETLFLKKMTRKNFLSQLRQIDNGDNSARMHEVVNQSISQIRENTKFATSQRTSLETFYKDIRKDMGLNELSEKIDNITEPDENTVDKGDKIITDNRKMNEMIENFLKNGGANKEE